MESITLCSDLDIQEALDLMKRLSPNSTFVDFYEQMFIPTIRATLRIWKHDHKIIGFAYVDDFNNLVFETEPKHFLLDTLENEIMEWGVTCMKSRNAETGAENDLDYCCSVDDSQRIKVMKKYDFKPQDFRTLRYSRPLNEPIVEYSLPDGFSIRCVDGKSEVERLVSLHQAAFGTNNMTIEQRLAMMSAPQYIPEMDLVIVAPNGALAAFCVCGFNDPDQKIGYTDPIGTHPHYQRMGLGKAIVSTGLMSLKNSGAVFAELGTSSENVAMQKLASELGFICVSEKLWFSKVIS